MSVQFFDYDKECSPLAKLVALQEANLAASKIIEYAAPLALYRNLWKKHGISAQPLTERRQLQNLPYTSSAIVKQAYAQYDLPELVNLDQVRAWSCTSGTTGEGKWIPYTDIELETFKHIVMRNFYVYSTTEKPHRVLAFTSPAPFVGDLITNLTLLALSENGFCQEFIPIGLNADADIISLAIQRKADVMVAFPSVAMRVAEELTANLKSAVERQYRETKNLKFLLAMLLFKFKKPSARDAFKMRYGLFAGESVEPYRAALRETFGFEPYETYALTEFPCLNMDCTEHDGIHIWSDCCIPEIIPQDELDREETEPGYIPRAVFLDEAEEGTIGEYVVTTFNRAFPLIRYRTSDLMRLVSKSPCKCGRTHPRIKVLRRLDDIINMGMIRFSLQDMENALARVCRNGTVEQWQICLSRKGYKPLPKLHVCGCNISDATAFTGEIGQVLSGINVLEMGIKNGLVCQPEIYVEDKIENKTTATGKTQRVIYDANW